MALLGINDQACRHFISWLPLELFENPMLPCAARLPGRPQKSPNSFKYPVAKEGCTQRIILNAVVFICKKHSALHSVMAQITVFIYLLIFSPEWLLKDSEVTLLLHELLTTDE